jgi:hypothetical protein
MNQFMSLFEHQGMYLLPDNTPVRALLYNLECLSLEWLFEDLNGIRKIAVLPNGDVIAYSISGRDQFGYLYYVWRTDMTMDDIRPAS